MIKNSKLKVLSVLTLLLIFSCSSDSSNNDEIDENLPVLTTTSVTLITDTSAQSGGTITDEGTSPVLTKGICWSTTQNPTINDNVMIDSGNAGSFTSNLTDLEAETTYFVRSYATNTTGIAYGNQIEFTTDVVVQVNAPCTPTVNTINHQGITVTFSSIQADEVHAFYGNYGVFASGLRGDMRVDFSHVPESGVYTLVSSFSLNQTLNESIITATLDQGTFNSWCTSGPSTGDLIYVNKLGEDSYEITFCNIEFSCLVANTNYTFTTNGNITD